MSLQERSDLIRTKAIELGFDEVGFAKVATLNDEGDRLKDWLAQGYQGQMHYLENHYELRIDPQKLLPDAQSVVCLSYNYFPEQTLTDKGPQIAKYAYGKDYHKLLRKKLKQLLQTIQDELPGVSGRACVDSAPIMEREWAKRAGLGWYGKNGLIINPKKGSYFFLAELLLNVPLEYTVPISDHCGTCTRCISACPTEAIAEEGYTLDASKCISYLTIELKADQIPEAYKSKMENWIFGCDICQDVCPWNKFSKPHNESKFLPSEMLEAMESEDWAGLTQEKFDALFVGSAVRRTGFAGLQRNIKAIRPDTEMS